MTTPTGSDKIAATTVSNQQPPKQWADATREMLDTSLASLDDNTLQRLAKARQQALSVNTRHFNPIALWGSVAASIAVITLLSVQLNQDSAQPLPANEENLAMLLEDIDLLEQMDMLSAMEELGGMVNDA